MSSRSAASRLGLALLLLLSTGSLGCWEQMSAEWFPQMKRQIAVQAFEDNTLFGGGQGLTPPEGTVSVGNPTPLMDRLDLAAQDPPRKRVQHEPLNGALERAGAVGQVHPLPGDEVLGLVVEHHGQIAVAQPLPQALQLDVHDLAQRCLIQPMEDDGLIHPIQELRPEMGMQGLHDIRPHLRLVPNMLGDGGATKV